MEQEVLEFVLLRRSAERQGQNLARHCVLLLPWLQNLEAQKSVK